MKNVFIYVFDIRTKDKLLFDGFALIKSDTKNNVYIFEYKDTLTYVLNEDKYVLSNILSF